MISIKPHQEYNALQERNTNRSDNAEKVTTNCILKNRIVDIYMSAGGTSFHIFIKKLCI